MSHILCTVIFLPHLSTILHSCQHFATVQKSFRTQLKHPIICTPKSRLCHCSLLQLQLIKKSAFHQGSSHRNQGSTIKVFNIAHSLTFKHRSSEHPTSRDCNQILPGMSMSQPRFSHVHFRLPMNPKAAINLVLALGLGGLSRNQEVIHGMPVTTHWKPMTRTYMNNRCSHECRSKRDYYMPTSGIDESVKIAWAS